MEYEPKSPGVYTVMVYFAEKEIPSSPIKVKVEASIDLSKVRVEGLEPSKCYIQYPLQLEFKDPFLNPFIFPRKFILSLRWTVIVLVYFKPFSVNSILLLAEMSSPVKPYVPISFCLNWVHQHIVP